MRIVEFKKLILEDIKKECPDYIYQDIYDAFDNCMDQEDIRLVLESKNLEYAVTGTKILSYEYYFQKIKAANNLNEDRITASTLLAMPIGEDIKYLVKGLVPANSMIQLAGAQKSKKSLFGLSLAIHLAKGLPFLGKETAICKVLYCDEENGISRNYRRLKMLMRGLGLEDDDLDNLEFVINKGQLLWQKDYGASIAKSIEEHIIQAKPQLLILDSFIAFFEGNENQSNEVRGALKIITRWIEKYDLSVIVLHHLRKPDINHSKTNVYDVRGSGDFLAFVDMLYMLEPSGENIMLKQEINRDDAVNDAIKLKFVFDKEKKIITLTNEGEAPYQHSKDNKQDICKEAIKEWFGEINQNEGRYSAERKEIITIMLSRGFTKSTIERALLELLFKDKFFKKKENREKYTLNYDKLQRAKDNFNEAS